MASAPKILAFAGSTREASHNQRLIRIAAEGARAAGALVMLIDLRDYPLPLYDADLHGRDGMPEPARQLRALLTRQQGLLISSPEYNGSLSGVLKNTLDWLSRGEQGGASLEPFAGKVAGIMAASPGALGGLRGLAHLRQILTNLGILVLPQQRAIGQAASAFGPDGQLADGEQQAQVLAIGSRLSDLLRKLAT